MDPCGFPGAAQSCPPCASTIDRQMDRPIPIPCGLVVKNASKMRVRSLGSMPVPQSATVIRTVLASSICVVTRNRRVRSVNGAHRLDRVHGQIEQNLLQRHPLAGDVRQVFAQFGLQHDPLALELALSERENVAHEIVDAQRRSLLAVLAEHSADAGDDVAGAVAVVDDPLQHCAHLIESGSVPASHRKPALPLATIAASG